MANKFYGIFKTVAINCMEESELCEEEFQQYDHPAVKVFSSNIRNEGEKYIGDINVNKIARFAVKRMESFVSFVSNENYDNFIN